MELTEKQLFEMRKLKIITTAEYMILKNFHFGNWVEFQKFVNIRKNRMRELYKLGIEKIKIYAKTLEKN